MKGHRYQQVDFLQIRNEIRALPPTAPQLRAESLLVHELERVDDLLHGTIKRSQHQSAFELGFPARTVSTIFPFHFQRAATEPAAGPWLDEYLTPALLT